MTMFRRIILLWFVVCCCAFVDECFGLYWWLVSRFLWVMLSDWVYFACLCLIGLLRWLVLIVFVG